MKPNTTFFERCLNGEISEYWKQDAYNKIAKAEQEIIDGTIEFRFGVPYWAKVNRVVPKDYREYIAHGCFAEMVDEEKTVQAYRAETQKVIADYRERMKDHEYTDEEIFEMRAAFGTGVTITDVFTGRKIKL